MAENPKFEDALEQLEKLVEELEGGELDLDEALKRFEKGVKLSSQLNASLEEANRKVEKLVVGPTGEAKRSPLDDEGEAAPKKGRAKKPKADQDGLF